MGKQKNTPSRIKSLFDEFGVIREAARNLPSSELKLLFLDALAKLEDNECHRTRTFPKTRLHKVKGIAQAVFHADIDKLWGWRIHVQYRDQAIHLKDIIEGQRHDDVVQVIKTKKGRYE